MAKIQETKKIKATNAPEVNEDAIQEVAIEDTLKTMIEETKEEIVETKEETKEDLFVKQLTKLVEAKIVAGGNRFLSIEEILPVFTSIVK